MSGGRKRMSLNTQVVVQQTKPGSSLRMSMGGVGGMSTIHRNVTQSYHAPPGHLATKSKQAVSAVMAEKDKEKREMGDLNQKLASYIENRQYLESSNKMLQDQVEALKKLKIPDFENLRDEYKEELQSYRDALQEAKDGIADYESKIVGLQDDNEAKSEEITMLRKQIADLENRLKSMATNIGDLEGECKALRREVENLTLSNDHLKADNHRLNDEINRLRADLDHARAEQIRACQLQDAEKAEHEFDNDTYTKEIDLLQEEIRALKAAQPDCKQYFTTGFRDAVAELQRSYDQNLNDRMAQLQSSYEQKIVALQNAARKPDATDSSILKSEMKTLKSKMSGQTDENTKLRRELEDMRAKYDDLVNQFDLERDDLNKEIARLEARIAELEAELAENDQEVDMLMASKIDLESEIAMYRKLLEGEQMSLRSVVERQGNIQSSGGAMMSDMIMQGGGSASQSSTISQSSGRVNLQKKCRGALQLSEVRTDGQFVELENTGATEIDVSGYTITRQTNKGKIEYQFPPGTKMAGRGKLRVYGNAFDEEARKESRDVPYIVAEKSRVNIWATGDGSFVLCDAKGSEKASATLVFSR